MARFSKIWVNVFMGYSDVLAFDQEPQFSNTNWNTYFTQSGIPKHQSGVESHNSLEVGERYHSCLRRTFESVKPNTPSTSDELELFQSIRDINDTAAPSGLIPTLLVFGVVLRIPVVTKHLPEQAKRFKTVRLAREEMTRIMANERIKMAVLRNVAAAADKEIIVGSEVLMIWEKLIGKWVGPHLVFRRAGKLLELDSGVPLNRGVRG